MNHYQNILLTIDFSDDDHYVAHKAKQLADIFNAKLNILHVLDNIAMPDTAYGTVISLDTNSAYEALEVEKSKMISISNQLNIESSRRWMIWGEPKQEIIRLSQQENIDLIVTGSHGRHGLAMLLGSTANSILHYASCDVLAVRLPGN